MALTKVTNNVLTDGAVHTASLAADAVNGTKIADNAINSEHITSGAIDTAHIADSQITAAKIASDAVTTAKVLDANITTAKIADANITTAKLADDAVTAAKLASDVAGTGLTSTNGVLSVNATGASGLQDGAVSTAKLADDAVTLAKIADAVFVTESEGIGSNDNDTTLPTSAAVKDYVDGQGIAALTASDGGFVVGNGSSFVVETGSTARDSIGLGTSGHIQFHCLGVGQAASTNNGQIDATTLYASGNIGKDSGDYVTWTTDTQMDFYVNGSNEMRLEADGDLHVDGDVIAASTTVASDEKLKENIKPIFGALEALSKIKGVDFNWKKDGSKASGVIAQDVQKIMPHAVKEVSSLDGSDNHLTVDYNAVIGLLVAAVNELAENCNCK